MSGKYVVPVLEQLIVFHSGFLLKQASFKHASLTCGCNWVLSFSSGQEVDEAAGPMLRDRSHIEDTLQLATVETSAEFSG